MEFGDPRLLRAFLVSLEDLRWLVALQEVVINLLGNVQMCLSVHGHVTPSSLSPPPRARLPQVAGCGEPGREELQWTPWTRIWCFSSAASV